jgi:uncharacterized protein YecE (DUF72 family)
MIRLGTSGFSYADWVGEVYPQELPRWQWLPFYTQSFDTVELNVTYYRMPDAKLIRGWIDRTPDDFLFTVKAHKSLTHERNSPDFNAFSDSIAELKQAHKLACVLAQFPHSFHPTPQNRNYLNEVREGLKDFPVVVEFRGKDWIQESTFEQLEQLGLGFCCVDEPNLPKLMPRITRVTSPVAYVRFHGRNSEKWWRHDHAWERYDYTYTEEELKEWVPKIRDLDNQATLTLVYANNHYKGQSVDTIQKLQPLLIPLESG